MEFTSEVESEDTMAEVWNILGIEDDILAELFRMRLRWNGTKLTIRKELRGEEDEVQQQLEHDRSMQKYW